METVEIKLTLLAEYMDDAQASYDVHFSRDGHLKRIEGPFLTLEEAQAYVDTLTQGKAVSGWTSPSSYYNIS